MAANRTPESPAPEPRGLTHRDLHPVLAQHPEPRPAVHPGLPEPHAAGGHAGLGSAVSN